MLRTTTWKPDTCECVMEYEWDDQLPESTRVHSPAKIVEACSVHDNGDNLTKHFGKVLEENVRRNDFFKKIMDTLPAFAKTDADGNKTVDIEKIKWSFDANRKLQIEIVGIKTAEKTAIKAIANTLFANKVNII